MKDHAIGDAFLEMWREDFVEKDSEKKALSREDRWFLEKMEKSIGYSQGHYVLPLPLQKKTAPEQSVGASLKDGGRLLGKKDTDHPEAVSIDIHNKSQKEEKVSIMSMEEFQGLSNGKFGVAKTGREIVVMPENRYQAMQRAKSLKRRMVKEKGFHKEYSAFVKKLLASGYAAKVPEERLGERAWIQFFQF